jgi:hypothetical protein
MRRQSISMLTLLLAVSASCADDSDLKAWARVASTFTPTGGDSVCVVGVRVRRLVPEIRRVKIESLYLIVEVESVLKPYGDRQDKSPDKSPSVDYTQPKAGDVLCVRLPRKFDPRKIEENRDALIMPVSASASRFKDIERTIESLKNDATTLTREKQIAELSLQNVPFNSIWVQLSDEGLLLSAGWHGLFERIALEADIMRLTASETDAAVQQLAGLRLDDNAEGKISKLISHPSVRVRLATAEYLLDHHDSRGVVLLAQALSQLNHLFEPEYQLPDPILLNKQSEEHNQNVVAMQVELPRVISNLRKYVSAKFLESERLAPADVAKWISNVSPESIKFDSERQKFIIKE